jgi:hypothetical protein
MNVHFFCHPKPWLPEFASIQRSAIESWLQLKPTSITLLGNDQGTAEAAKHYGLRHLGDVQCNEWGTPLVSSIFERIRGVTQPDDIVCYINADIILDETFPLTVNALKEQAVGKKEWLAVGKRTDVDLAIDDDGYPTHITVADAQQLADERGSDHGWSGIDYFIFPSRTFMFVYPFALGKFVWDQWLVGNAFRRGLWTVDCSKTLLAIHLNCPWYRDGQPTEDRQAIHDSEEGTKNRSFDYYQKTILSGTKFESKLDKQGRVKFEEKTLIPE